MVVNGVRGKPRDPDFKMPGGLPSRKISELDFRRQLVGTEATRPGLAIIYGWEHVGFRAAQTSHGWRTPVTGSMGLGWPDLVLLRARDRRLIFAELKKDVGKLSVDQEHVLELLRAIAWPRCTCNGPLAGIRFGAQEKDGKLHDSGCAAIGGAFSDMATRIEVFVWRPADLEQIAEVLK